LDRRLGWSQSHYGRGGEEKYSQPPLPGLELPIIQPVVQRHTTELSRFLENRVLRRIFGPKRDTVAEDWIRLHNQELHNLYALQNTFGVMK
jgi:hypothetical protein